jgi:hypothetical protein
MVKSAKKNNRTDAKKVWIFFILWFWFSRTKRRGQTRVLVPVKSCDMFFCAERAKKVIFPAKAGLKSRIFCE